MPVATSIQWRPLRDPHYVVASLQPGGGGLRGIFARQSTLREVQALIRGDPERPLVGLLLGERLECSLTRTPYVLIESHVEVALASLDERAVSDAIRTLRGHVPRRNSVEVLGWYCTSRSADAAVSRTHAAVHAAAFTERWQSVLVFGNSGNTGAFFLYDSSAARWFHAPFNEVVDGKEASRAPKPTCVEWPAYLTTALVVPFAEARQAAPLPRRASFAPAPVSPPASNSSATIARQVVPVPRTQARDAAGDVVPPAAPAQLPLDLAKTLGGGIVTASRHLTDRILRIRADWAASAAQRKVEAEAERVREEERRAREEARQAKQAAERRAAREEAQRQAAEEEKRRAAEAEARRSEEAEARRKAAEEAQRLRAAEAEAKRQAAEAEARRRAEEAEARRVAEAEARRKAAEEAERRRAQEAEAKRVAAEAEAEAKRKAAEADAEAKRKAAEADAEAKRKAAEAEARRQAAEAEARRQAAEVEALRRAKEAEARRAAEAEAQRKAAEEAQRKAAETEARRKAAEEAQRKAAEEAQRKAAEIEALRKAAEEAQRKAAEEQRRRAAEVEAARQAAEAEARRHAAEAEARRLAEAQAEALRQAAEAEARRLAEAEAQRVAAEAAARRLAEEAKAEEQRKAAAAEAEARQKAAAEEAEARRKAAAEEAEARQKAAAAEAEARRKAAEAEEDARRKAAAEEEEARRRAAEAEALRISVEVAAIRERFAGAPIEGSRREVPRVFTAQMADLEDTTASDGPYRYLAFARREGFEVSERIERGSSETVWLLHERESGLRLYVVTTDEAVREASLHYNLRTEDDSLLRITAPEHRDLESRTIYGREECLHDLRARCRRLRATGALQRDWKVSPTIQHSASPRLKVVAEPPSRNGAAATRRAE